MLKVYNFFDFQNVASYILFLGVFLISSILVSNSYQAFMTWAMTKFTNMQGHRLAVRLLENYLMQPYSFFLVRNSSDLGKNIIFEVHRVTRGVIMQSLVVFSKIIVVLFLFLLLIFVNPIIAFSATILLGGLYTLIFKLVKLKLYNLGLATTKDNFKLLKAANEAISGIKDIKLRRSEKEFINHFSLPSINIANYQAQKTLIASLPRYLLEVVAFGGIVAIIILLIAINKGTISTIIPVISLYVMASYRLMPAFQQIYSGLSGIKFDLPAFENIVREFSESNVDKKEQVSDSDTPISFNEKLQINKLDFTYESSEIPVLNKLDLTIYPNTTVGLVGLTGSGKTTLVDIILGLLTPGSGVILSDEVEIDSNNKSAWQKNIGYVPQSIFLIDDTIIANIAFAVPDDEVSIEKAEKAANSKMEQDFLEGK